MNLYGLFAILYTVLYVFDVCDSKCDEYIIVFQELSCGKAYDLMPAKIDEIVWKDLTYPYNTTEVYEEIQGYKECILEIDCNADYDESFACTDIIVVSNNTSIPANNTGEEKEKSNKTVSEKVYILMTDINIIYYITETDIQNSSNLTKRKSEVKCLYAETLCINEKEIDNSSFVTYNKESGINNTRTLTINLQRDPNAIIQPIFTGYFPQSLGYLKSIENNFKESKLVTFTCELLENINCRQNIANKSNKQINVYLKTNYIQNVTTRYLNCTKDVSTTNYSLNLSCDANDFAHYNPQILLASRVIDEAIIKPSNQDEFVMGVKDVLICKCQIASDFNYTDKHTNDSNVISFDTCSNYRNHKNEIEGSKVPNTDTRHKLNKTETIQNTEENKGHLSGINEDNIVTIRITENGDNCSHNSPLSIHLVKIILEDDLEARNSKEKILGNNNVVLNISNCINIDSSVLNNTEIKTELAIFLKTISSFNTYELFDKSPEDSALKQKIILKCDRPYLVIDSSDANVNKTILECKSLYLENFYNTTDVDINFKKQNTSHPREKVNTDPTEKHNNETKIDTDEPKTKTVTSNETLTLNRHNYTDHNETKINTDKHEAQTKNCTLNETIALNNHTTSDNSTNYVQNRELENDTTASERNTKSTTFNRKKDMAKGLGQGMSLVPESDEPLILLTIILSSVAAGCILVVITLKKCTKKETYQPTATREPPDEEDTAF